MGQWGPIIKGNYKINKNISYYFEAITHFDTGNCWNPITDKSKVNYICLLNILPKPKNDNIVSEIEIKLSKLLINKNYNEINFDKFIKIKKYSIFKHYIFKKKKMENIRENTERVKIKERNNRFIVIIDNIVTADYSQEIDAARFADAFDTALKHNWNKNAAFLLALEIVKERKIEN